MHKYPILDDEDDDIPEDELEAHSNELQSEPVGDDKQHKYDQAEAEALYDNGDRKETQGNERASKGGEEKTGEKVHSETEKLLSNQPVKIMSKNRLMIPGVSKHTADDIPDLKKKEVPQEEGDGQLMMAFGSACCLKFCSIGPKSHMVKVDHLSGPGLESPTICVVPDVGQPGFRV